MYFDICITSVPTMSNVNIIHSLGFELENHPCEYNSHLKHVSLGRKTDPRLTYVFGQFLIPYDRTKPYS